MCKAKQRKEAQASLGRGLHDGAQARQVTRYPTYLGVQLDWVGDVANHLRAGELLLRLAILGHLEHANLVRPTRRELDLLGEVGGEIVHGAGLGQEEAVRRLFLVMDTRPDDLETALRLELHDRHLQLLIQDH